MESTLKQTVVQTDTRRPQQPHESLAALIACSRGQNALQRRALQLARWEEAERALVCTEQTTCATTTTTREPSLVSFSATTLFLSAVAQNDVLEAERLLSTSLVAIDTTNSDGLTALHQSCIDDNVVMARFLLERGANVNCRDNEGWTPLHATASCGHRELIALLLRFGADPRAVNCDGELAMDVSADDDYEVRQLLSDAMDLSDHNTCADDDDVTECVLRALRRQELSAIENDVTRWVDTGVCGAQHVIDSTTRATVLHVCAAKGYDEVLTRVLKHFAANIDVEARDVDGWTALHASAYWQQCETFETLCRFGADCDARTPSGQMARDLCHENTRILEIIAETEKARALALAARHTNNEQSSQPSLAPTLNTTPQSETQRRAHAKKVRETRRSTQGVRADDVEKARALIDSPDSSEDRVITTSEENDEKREAEQHVSTDDEVVMTATTTPPQPTPPESPPTPTIQLSLPRPTPLFIITKTPQNQSTTTPTTTTVRNHDNYDNNRIETNEDLNQKWNLKRINSLEQNDVNERQNNQNNNNASNVTNTENNATNVSYSVSRRRRPKRERRSTGISDDSDNNNNNNDKSGDDEEDADDSRSEAVVRVVLPSKQVVTASVAPSRDAREEREEKQKTTTTTTTAASTSVAVVSPSSAASLRSRSASSSRASSVDSSDSQRQQQQLDTRESGMRPQLDYKTLYYELLAKYETLSGRLSEREESDRKREHEWSRERRALQRRVSELEEELKALETLRTENSRLRDENGALIRVISKLSK